MARLVSAGVGRGCGVVRDVVTIVVLLLHGHLQQLHLIVDASLLLG